MSCWRLIISVCLVLFAGPVGARDVVGLRPGMAFHYGESPPVSELAHFEWVVLEPDHARGRDLELLVEAGSVPLAYLSLGEVDAGRSFRKELGSEIFAGKNESFGSDLVDQRQPGWRRFILERYVPGLVERGFGGLFLDTLDSYQLLEIEGSTAGEQAAALAALIGEIDRRFPGLVIVMNRGFELLDEVGEYVEGLVAESLFRGYDFSKREYVEVSEAARSWLLARFLEARDRHGLVVGSIDYVPPGDSALARQTVERIHELGLVPWVTDAGLQTMGRGLVEIVPRRVLVLYDQPLDGEVADSEAHRLVLMPLEHLGLVGEMWNLQRGLPRGVTEGTIAGIVSYLMADTLPDPEAYREWLEQQMDRGIRVAMLGRPGFRLTPGFLERLGLANGPGRLKRPVRVVEKDELIGFESPPRSRSRGLIPLIVDGERCRSHLKVQDATGRRVDVVVTADWGGLALDPYILERGYEERLRWILDPFTFLERALAVPPMPMPDVTTENGRRILLASIDGDGSVSRAELPGTPFALEVVAEEILKVYDIPTAVSVIEAETSVEGLWPQDSPELEALARDVFDLEHVEMASHTFSHPYHWKRVLTRPRDLGLRLPLKKYSFDLEREIDGSVSYINERLAPVSDPDKRVRSYLWSGNALPDVEALARVRALGMSNLNGGDTQISRENPSVTAISPQGRWQGDEYQVFAPIINENIYTNLWRGPFYGFRRVIETFEMTGSPRRLKAIHIYYHFYSGTRLDALRALKRVYDWSLARKTRPLHVSEFARKATAYQHLSLGRHLDGSWRVAGQRSLVTFRIPGELGWPDLAQSPDAATIGEDSEGRYLSLFPACAIRPRLVFRSTPPGGVHLVDTNAEVIRFRAGDGETLARFELRGHVNVQLTVGGVNGPCQVKWRGGTLAGERRGDHWIFEFPARETGRDAVLVRS